MTMPVRIWTKPSTSEPIRMAMVSVSGVNRYGRAKVLFGSMSLASWLRKSPKNPPVSAPTTKVLMPQSTSRPPM